MKFCFNWCLNYYCSIRTGFNNCPFTRRQNRGRLGQGESEFVSIIILSFSSSLTPMSIGTFSLKCQSQASVNPVGGHLTSAVVAVGTLYLSFFLILSLSHFDSRFGPRSCPVLPCVSQSHAVYSGKRRKREKKSSTNGPIIQLELLWLRAISNCQSFTYYWVLFLSLSLSLCLLVPLFVSRAFFHCVTRHSVNIHNRHFTTGYQ